MGGTIGQGIVAGLIFGAVAVATMIPMSFPNKRQAMLAAFASRFAIGFIVPNFGHPQLWLWGAVVGFLISLADAIVTRAWAPVLVLGTAGGAIIGAVFQWVL